MSASAPVDEVSQPPAVDKSGEKIRQMFGEISPRYDFLNHFLSGGIDYYWRWRTVRLVPPRGTAPILDVCTGTGDLALAYYKAAKGRVAVAGTDFTPEMLTIARQKAGRLKLVSAPEAARLDFQQADTQVLPFEDDRFQIVSVAFGLRNVADTKAGLREMTRVCRPGGRVAVLEFSLPGNPMLRSLYGWYFRNVLPRLGQWISGSRRLAYNYLPASVSEFPYGQALADMLGECGLTNVRYYPFTFGVATLYVGEKPASK